MGPILISQLTPVIAPNSIPVWARAFAAGVHAEGSRLCFSMPTQGIEAQVYGRLFEARG